MWYDHDDTTEVWKAIPGWEGVYEVSSEGQVRSVLRWVDKVRLGMPLTYLRQGGLLRQSPNTRGYLCVALNGNGRRITRARVHQLVAAAFLGPCPQGLGVLHNNGTQTDNRAINLRYGTQRDNLLDAVRHGTVQRGIRQRLAKRGGIDGPSS